DRRARAEPDGGRTFRARLPAPGIVPEVGNEELLVVIAGAPTLREPEGERVLRPGDCVLFLQGPEGAHQLINRTAEPVRVLFVSNFAMPRAAFQPDSGKIMVRWSLAEGDSLW